MYNLYTLYIIYICSTTENIAIYIWNSLAQLMPNPELLHEVKIHGTDKNVFFYRGESS